MLKPHHPSKNLRPPGSRQLAAAEDLADVHVTEVPYTTPPTPLPAVRAKPSGRSASINRRPPD